MWWQTLSGFGHWWCRTLKEIGRKDDGGSLVVKSSTVGALSASWKSAHHFFAVLEEGDGRVSIP